MMKLEYSFVMKLMCDVSPEWGLPLMAGGRSTAGGGQNQDSRNPGVFALSETSQF